MHARPPTQKDTKNPVETGGIHDVTSLFHSRARLRSDSKPATVRLGQGVKRAAPNMSCWCIGPKDFSPKLFVEISIIFCCWEMVLIRCWNCQTPLSGERDGDDPCRAPREATFD